MRTTQYILATLKEIPKNCEVISHQLMLRSGMIRQVSSGLYTWLPTGLRVLRKIENIIRQEMNDIGFIEILMPITQPAKLWKQSGRWGKYGPELLRFINRNQQEFILGPTHEEIISDLICKEIVSLNQLPIKLYQIYTKYRDEARPQFGLIRAKEFIMKDGYSFHTDQQSLQNTYDNIYQKYHIIFNRIKLNFFVIKADTGNIGGILSHEFQAYFNKQEFDKQTNISTTACNNNLINSNTIQHKNHTNFNKIQTTQYSSLPKETMRLINVSYNQDILEILKQLKLPVYKTIKIIVVRAKNKQNSYNFLGLVIRADHDLSHEKLLMISEIDFPLSILNIKDIEKTINIKLTLINFINLSIPLIIDHHVASMHDFVIESNTRGKYFLGVNWNRDLPMPKIADLHTPIYKKYKKIKKDIDNAPTIQDPIEIGHIFQLGNRYSNSIYNCIQKNNKYNLTITMGCYGLGITRIVPTIIEQHHDQYGIVWPDAIAPFTIAIIPINMHQSINVKKITEKLYEQILSIIGTDVLLDDRKEHPGIKFADIDLIGVPHIFIISDKHLNNKEIEYKYRKTGITKKINLDKITSFLIKNF